jgi:16S rRNA (cytosine967-C5)-methyltransferase
MSDAPDNPQRLPGRTAAYLAVFGVLQRQGFVSETLGGLRDSGRLDAREAGLATEIALGAVRHVLTLETILRAVATYDPARVTVEVRALLTTAAYQLIWMDRVPAFAAVNETVALAHQHAPRAAGMVNAILRRLGAAVKPGRVPWTPGSPRQVRVSWDQACVLGQDVFPPADPELDAYVAAAAGERPERLASLSARFGPQAAGAVAWASQAVPALVLHRHTLRISAADFARQIGELYGPAAHVVGDSAYLAAGESVLDTPLFRDGLAFVQDTTAQAAAALVRAQRGERVLDLCAAPGGKSVSMALAMGDVGEIVACDVAPPRLIQVSASVDRLGLTSIRTCLLDADADDLSVDGAFDAALVDVPCSNTGVIARRPEARLGFTARKLASLATLQARLLRRAAARVKPGGRLVYSTCCLEPQENEQVIDAFVAAQPEWQVDTAQVSLPAWGPTPADWRDGGFAARLVRS